MLRSYLIMLITACIVLSLLVVPSLDRISKSAGNDEQTIFAPSTTVPAPSPTVTQLPKDDAIEQPLAVELVTTDYGLQLQFQEDQYARVFGTVSAGEKIVHGVKRGSVIADAVVVNPTDGTWKVFSLSNEELAAAYYWDFSLFQLMNEREILYIRPSMDENLLVYDLMQFNIETGLVQTLLPRFWEVDQQDEREREDFLLSAHFEADSGMLLLSSFKGRLWLIDTIRGMARTNFKYLFPGRGDPGSGATPRELIYPSPDLQSFVYQQLVEYTEGQYFGVHHFLQQGAVAQFGFGNDKATMFPGIVWNAESSMFLQEFAGIEDRLWDFGSFDSYTIFAQGVQFYDKEGVLLGTLELPAKSDERFNVYAWLPNGQVLMEYFRPSQEGDLPAIKGEIDYKLYDIASGRLTSFVKRKDTSGFDDPLIVQKQNTAHYGSSPVLLVDSKNGLVWEAPVHTIATLAGNELYLWTDSKDRGGIQHWNQGGEKWEQALIEPDAYSEIEYLPAPTIHNGSWAVYEQSYESWIDYIPFLRTAE